MKTLLRVLLGFVSLLVVLLLVGLFLPRQVHVERQLTMKVPPEVVFDRVNHLPTWSEWSPWFAAEPDAVYTFSGPEQGVGATMQWKGQVVGEGSQRIAVANRPGEIETELDFGQQGLAKAGWRFAASELGTDVTWTLDTDMGFNPISRYFGLLMDRMLGPDYEKGLAKLKEVCEAQVAAAAEIDSTSPNVGSSNSAE